eukprot:Nk52_evm13s2635 gene=Nk52_evmTU13s2635
MSGTREQKEGDSEPTSLKKSILYTRGGDQGTSQLYNGERQPKTSAVFGALGDLDELISQVGLCMAYCYCAVEDTEKGEQGSSVALAREEGIQRAFKRLLVKDCSVKDRHSKELKNESEAERAPEATTFDYDRSGLTVMKMLEEIQCCLMDIASHLATPIYWRIEKEDGEGQGEEKCEEEEEEEEEKLKKRIQLTRFDPTGKLLKELEIWIDFIDSKNPPLRNFVLPGGGGRANLPNAHMHMARTVCRRTERSVVDAIDFLMKITTSSCTVKSKDPCNGAPAYRANSSTRRERHMEVMYQDYQHVQSYMNRLSDFFFAVARFLHVPKCFAEGGEMVYRRAGGDYAQEGGKDNPFRRSAHRLQ